MDEVWRILIPLLLAHIVTDFFSQTKGMVEKKRAGKWKSSAMLVHVLIAGSTAYAFTALWQAYEIFWITALSHWLIDGWKNSRKNPDKPSLFWADQSLHIFVIAGLCLWLTSPSIWYDPLVDAPWRESGIILLGFLFVLQPGSVIVQKVMSQWNLNSSGIALNEELPNAGHIIGLLERTLIFVFVVLQQFAAIGFLIAAKSILRFGSNAKNNQERKETEYILVGTLLSFTLATLTGLIVTWIL